MNVSRPDFFKEVYLKPEIKLEDIAIGDLFDEVMALYNIVSDDYISVNKAPSTDCLSKFLVQFDSVEKARNTYNTMQGKDIVMYDKHIQIICWYEGDDKITISFHSLHHK